MEKTYEPKKLDENDVLVEIIYEDKQKSKVKAFKTKEELKKFIKGISSSDLKREDKKYYFYLTKKTKQWFNELYKKRFFTINEEKGHITLNSLPNGIRRAKVYKKKVDNEKTLKQALKRIVKTIEPKISSLDYAFELKNEEIIKNDTFEKNLITIKFVDLREKSYERFDYPMINIIFDRLTWEYKFVLISLPRDFKEIETIVRRGFEKHTASTRNYRAKKGINANNAK